MQQTCASPPRAAGLRAQRAATARPREPGLSGGRPGALRDLGALGRAPCPTAAELA